MSALLKVLKITGYVIAGFVVYQALIRLVRHYWHFPAPAFITVFLNSRLRKKLQNPMVLIGRSGIKPGQKVLEIGCGGGFFLSYAAQTVWEGGMVYGLDIAADMLERSRRYLSTFPAAVTGRVELVQRSAYELPFDDSSLDVVYLVATLMEIPDPRCCLAEVLRVLKPQGILAVSEFLVDPDYPGRKANPQW
jgi:ubiquinone/menaquinone biosynthesis C-methylase UbiE